VNHVHTMPTFYLFKLRLLVKKKHKDRWTQTQVQKFTLNLIECCNFNYIYGC